MVLKQVIFLALFSAWNTLVLASSFACNPPLLSGVEDVTTTSFTLKWSDFNSGVISWEIEYLETGHERNSIPTLTNIQDKSIEVTNLNPGTAYDVYIRSKCSEEGISAWNGPFMFRTAIDNELNCGLGLAIADNNCPQTEDFLIVVDGYDNLLLGIDIFIQSVDLQLAHDWPADLQLQLVNPEGNAIDLITNRGIGKDNFGDLMDTLCQRNLQFSDFSCQRIDSLKLNQIVGSFLPEQKISDLYQGNLVNGIWKLRMCDRASDDVGLLEHIKINFSPIICNAPTEIAAINIDAQKVDIRWTPESDCSVAIINVVEAGSAPGSGIEIFTTCQVGLFNIDQLKPNTSYDIYIKSDCGQSESSFSCPVTFTTACSAVSGALSFDDLNVCDKTCLSACPLEDNTWKNIQTDKADWLVVNGTTPTDQTGPSGDIITIGNYAYLENAIDLCGTERTAILETNCLLIADNGEECDFSFYYHMYGINVNQLSVKVSIDDGNTWIEVFSLQGDQGNQWHRQYIDLQDFAGLYAKIRFEGVTGDGDRSDMAIDQIEFYGSEVVTVLPIFYFDKDQDGYGTPDSVISFCLNNPPDSYSDNDLDCEDGVASINPGKTESPCNAIDDNCDGLVDEVEENPILINLLNSKNETCPGANDGSIEIEIIGGVPPYSIQWNNGGHKEFLDGLSEGIYFAEVVDALNCRSRSDFYEIDQENVPTIFYHNIKNTQCGQTIGIIDIEMAGGIAPYSFLWSSGETSEDLLNIDEGNYQVTATDHNGCQVVSEEIEIIASPRFTAGVQFKRELRCFGDSNGIISIGVINAVPPVVFAWNNGDSIATIEDLKAGMYTVTISDARGCDEVITTEIAVPDPLVSMVSGIEQVTCYDETNGSIQVNTSGGKSPFDFTWMVEPDINLNNNKTEDLTSISAGQYQLFVRDGNGCETNTEIVEIINPPPISIDIEEMESVACRFSRDGKLRVRANGGNGDYEYFWSNGEKGQELDSLFGGNYSIRVIDQLGCKAASNDLEVSISNTPINLSLGLLKDNFCSYDSSGVIYAEVYSNITYPLDFNWSNGTQNILTFPNDTLKNLPPGNYNVTVTDALGCTGSEKPLSLLPIDELVISEIAIQSTSCNSNHDGSVALSIIGGTPPYSFTWSSGDSSNSLQGIPNGKYTVEISDQNGCFLPSDTIVIESGNPILIDAKITNTSNGMDNGRIDIEVTGGTPPYQIEWSTNNQIITALENLSIGEYCIHIADDIGCEVEDCFTITNSTSVTHHIDSKVEIFPNPFHKELKIQSDKSIDEIILYNPNGEEILRKSNFRHLTLNPVHIKPGVYLIQLLTKSKIRTFKIIKI